MKAFPWKKVLPHIIAVVSFIIVAMLFCKPSLQGKILYQHDVIQYEGASKDIANYAEKHGGEAPLWTNGMFSGMPTYQIWMPTNNLIPKYVNGILTLGLPKPMQFFFLACLLFYFLSQIARVNPYIGMLGAFAFAYATYNPVIIAAGHVTKMWCIAYMPALLASLMLIYRKKYIVGTALLALFTATQIGLNHLQISYYTFLILAFYTLFCIVGWLMRKEYLHLTKALALTVIGALIGIMVNSVTLLTTYEYSKETIRGGTLSLKDSASHKGSGLTKDYAFSYSYKPMEAFTVMFPHIYGGSNGNREFGEESNFIKALSEMPQQLAQQLGGMQNAYWGGLDFTSGPSYIGALTCFLFILSLFVIKGNNRWWILSISIFAIIISWGKFFPQFNNLLFNYLPLYNKFRAPSMSMVILQLLWPLAGIWALQALADNRKDAATWPRLKNAGYATLGVFAIALMAYVSFSYTDEGVQQLKQQVINQPEQIKQPVFNLIKGLVNDRKSFFFSDIFKAFALIGVFFLALYLFIKNKLKSISWLAAIGIVLLFIDLMPIGYLYFTKKPNSDDSFADESETKQELVMGKANQLILQDKSNYRVLNLTASPFQDAVTSYFHQSIGGYHAAKIGRYQDLIENKLGQEIGLLNNDSTLQQGLSQSKYTALNMLNAKYIIGSNPSQLSKEEPFVIKNVNALGPVWFVKEVRFADSLTTEMKTLNGMDASQTAVVSANDKNKVTQPVFDSTAKIEQVSNDNDIIKYKSSAKFNQFAVFSEVYYSEGWHSYIDGKKVDYVKANYTLRGMNIPAGNHDIEFKFEPASYSRGRMLTSIGQVLTLLLLAGGIFVEVRRKKTEA